jgi:hypothetical protein
VTDVPTTYAPHIWCLIHDSRLVTLHVLADAMIVTAYVVIAASLIYCAQRRDLLFREVFFWFGAFTILCAVTHAGNILEVWRPLYWLTAGLKLIAGVVSLITMVKILPILPQVFRLPSLTGLEQVRQYMLRPQAERMEEMVRELDKVTKLMALFTHTSAPSGGGSDAP